MAFYYNQNDYGNVAYNKPDGTKKTIKTSGCGVVSACIVFNSLAGKELYTVAQMAKFSISVGARNNYGTDEGKLLTALCKANKGFTYKTTNDVNKVVSHLKAGGMVICNQGDVYNVFSTAGHFVVADRMVGSSIDILDPQMYSGKYDAYDRPKRIVSRTSCGCVVSANELSKACADRSPAYFLITYTGRESTMSKYGNAYMKSAQTVYCDSDLTTKIGSVSSGERVYYLGTGEGNVIITYRTAKGYKAGFVKANTVKKD
jgi:hypothetical protein